MRCSCVSLDLEGNARQTEGIRPASDCAGAVVFAVVGIGDHPAVHTGSGPAFPRTDLRKLAGYAGGENGERMRGADRSPA